MNYASASQPLKSLVEEGNLEEKPLVSVIVPAYNYEGYVGQCVQSVLDQDYPRLEVIVVENGSKDGTREVLRSFEDPRITLIELDDNIGWAGAIQTGFDRSLGEGILMLSADDFLVPTHVSRLVAYLGEHPDISVVGTWVRVVNAEGIHWPEEEAAYTHSVNREWDPDDMKWWAADHHFQLPSGLFRREHLAVSLPERGSDRSGDWALHVAVLKNGGRFAVIPEPLFCLRSHGSNLSHRDTAWQATYELCHWFRHLFVPTCEMRNQPQAAKLMMSRQAVRVAEENSMERTAFALRCMLAEPWQGSLNDFREAAARFRPESATDYMWMGLAEALNFGYRDSNQILSEQLQTALQKVEQQQHENRKLASKIKKLEKKLRSAEKHGQKVSKEVARWNGRSWFTRAFHKLRLRH